MKGQSFLDLTGKKKKKKKKLISENAAEISSTFFFSLPREIDYVIFFFF